MLYLLDTNTVSYIINKRFPVVTQRLREVSDDSAVAVSSVTEAELLYGLARVQAGRIQHEAVEALLLRLQVLPWGRTEASTYGRLRTTQEKAGLSLSPLDMLIAAHAVAIGAVLVTHDAAFRNVSALTVEDWVTGL